MPFANLAKTRLDWAFDSVLCGGSDTVTGAPRSLMIDNVTGRLLVDGLFTAPFSYVDDTPFTVAVDELAAVGGIVTGDAVDVGDVGAFGMSTFRSQYGILTDDFNDLTISAPAGAIGTGITAWAFDRTTGLIDPMPIESQITTLPTYWLPTGLVTFDRDGNTRYARNDGANKAMRINQYAKDIWSDKVEYIYDDCEAVVGYQETELACKWRPNPYWINNKATDTFSHYVTGSWMPMPATVNEIAPFKGRGMLELYGLGEAVADVVYPEGAFPTGEMKGRFMSFEFRFTNRNEQWTGLPLGTLFKFGFRTFDLSRTDPINERQRRYEIWIYSIAFNRVVIGYLDNAGIVQWCEGANGWEDRPYIANNFAWSEHNWQYFKLTIDTETGRYWSVTYQDSTYPLNNIACQTLINDVQDLRRTGIVPFVAGRVACTEQVAEGEFKGALLFDELRVWAQDLEPIHPRPVDEGWQDPYMGY